MTYEQQQENLTRILSDAEGGGYPEFFDLLTAEVKRLLLSGGFRYKKDGGNLSGDECTTLIVRAYFVLSRIQELKQLRAAAG